MRILLCNNRYFMSGGPERYLFSTEKALRDRGHHVVPFAIAYDANQPTPHAAHFVPAPVGPEYVMYGDRRLGPGEKLKLFASSLYYPPARSGVMKVIEDQKIDVVYTVQIGNLLSPAVLDGAHARSRPIVSRLSDFQLLCPAYHFLRDSRPCEECTASLLHAVRHRCLKDSYLVSAARVMGMYLERLLGSSRRVSRFVTTTDFMRRKLLENGFEPDRVVTLRTPVIVPADVTPSPGSYALYSGNLNEHKGVDVLIEAMARLPDIPVKLAGTWSPASRERIAAAIEQHGARSVEMVGFREGDALLDLYREAAFLIHPTLWYENSPNAVLEAMAQAKPIVASDIGSMGELVEDGKNGRLVPPRDAASLARAIEELWGDGALRQRMGLRSLEIVRTRHDPEKHYTDLLELFSSLLGS